MSSKNRSSKNARKAERERSVFRSFVKVSLLPVVDSSIESRCSPEPDILCTITGEGSVAFELTALEAEQYQSDRAEQRRNLDKMQTFRTEVSQYAGLEKRYWGAVLFLDETKERKLPVQKVCQLLAAAPHNCEQLFLLENGIDLRRGDGNHPPRLLADAIEIAYAIYDHIAKKLGFVINGVLKSSVPIEILAHFDFETLWAGKMDWENIADKLRTSPTAELLSESRVKRVWIFDQKSEVIRFVSPPL